MIRATIKVLKEAVCGSLRRIYRKVVCRKLRTQAVFDCGGCTHMLGYGMRIRYINQRIWIYQFDDIFVRDVYGVRKLPERAVVVDCGANIGMFAAYVMWRRPEASVLSIEPDPLNAQCCADNVGVFKPRVRLVQAALGSSRGLATLSGEASDAFRTNVNRSGGSVPVLALDDLEVCGNVDLLKIDVEGSEVQVLEGGVGLLPHVERVVIECHLYHGETDRTERMMELLRVSGFNRFRICEHREFCRDNSASSSSLPIACWLIEAWRTYPCGMLSEVV